MPFVVDIRTYKLYYIQPYVNLAQPSMVKSWMMNFYEVFCMSIFRVLVIETYS